MPDDKCNSFLNFLPFVGLAMGNVKNTPLTTRLAEAAIMSFVAAGVSMYAAVEVISVKLDTVKERVERVDSKISKVDDKVENLRKDFYIPRN